MKSRGIAKLICISAIALSTLCLGTATIFFSSHIPQLSAKYSIEQFFPKNHKTLLEDEMVKKTFELRSVSGFLVIVDLPNSASGDWFEPTRMEKLKLVSRKLAALKNAKSVLSLASVEMAIEQGDELRIGSIMESLPPEKWSSYVESNSLLRGQVISKDKRSVLVVVEPATLDTDDLLVMEDSIRSTFIEEMPENSIGIAGVQAMQSRLSQKLISEVGRFLILCLVVFVAMFATFYRHLSPVLFTLVGLVISNAIVLGGLAWLGLSFSVLLSTLPIMVSIAFVSVAIHTLHLWAEKKDNFVDKGWLGRWFYSMRIMREISFPNFLGSLTTAIGFIALATAAIPAIKDYALIVAGSVMVSFVVASLMFLMFLSFISPFQRDWISQRAWWTIGITRMALPIVIVVVVVSMFMGGSAFRLNFSSRLFDDLPEKEAVSRAMMKIDKTFGGTVGLDISVVAERANSWNDPSMLERLRVATEQVRAINGVGSVVGLTDFMGAHVPASSGGVAELFFLFSMSTDNPLRHYVDNDLRKTRLALRIRDVPSNDVDEIRKKTRDLLLLTFPGSEVVESGLAVQAHEINREVARELVYGFWHSLVIIGVLLAIIFRSVRWAIIACIPNLVPPAVLLGTLAMFQTPVKPGIALILSIALGLAFNNTVYLLSRLRRMSVEYGTIKRALARTLLEEGHPCLSESLVMFAGFIIFLSSDFKMNQTFGGYMVLSIVAGALADLVFLPALLKLFPRFWAESVGLAKSIITGNKAAGLVGSLVFGALVAAPSSARADESGSLLKKARRNLESKSDQATVTLKIIESNGDTKTRSINMKAMSSGGDYYAIARIISPADVKGTALLAEIKDGAENQWIYLPSSQQVRRVVSGQKSAGVLGSELNPQDLNVEILKGASAKLVSKDAKLASIEIKPKTATETYDSAIITLTMPESLPEKIEYRLAGKATKTVEFKDYEVQSGVHRAKKISIRNLQNGRGTDVELADLKINEKLDKSAFSQNALKSE
ncbi:MAG: outer membrane lipoprotein-sorting protein [Bdellovibrionota bacterium]